jgi:ribosomal protein S18 acetylase RimI-like enzyme
MPAKLSVRLRPITPEDDSFLRRLFASTRADELAITGWSEEQKAAFCRMQFDAQSTHYHKHYPKASFQIIERGGVAAGRLLVHRSEKEILIVDISLLPEHRGAGLGSKLLRELQEEARSAGKPLTIHVERFNPALRLYERLGFKKVEEQEVYLLMEWGGNQSGNHETRKREDS